MKMNKGGSSVVIEVDFRGVNNQGICPEGIYKVRVDKVTQEISEKSDKPYLAWVFKTREGYTLYYNTSLQPQALFNLKRVLEALNYEVPQGIIKLNLKQLVGLEAYVEVAHEMYDGKKKPRIVEFLKPDEVEEGEEEEEEVEEEEESSEEEEEEEEELSEGDEESLDKMSLEELLALAEENDIDLTSLSKKDRKDPAKILAVIKDSLEEDEGD